ncbi:MAG TPA: type II secretion system F family protein [Caulobacter sp.]|nr:type II secretion system F family protein [Caulobacter sp.]
MSRIDYRYRAINAAGRRVSGRLTATGEADAHAQLRRDGLTPLSLKVEAAGQAAVTGQSIGPLSDRAVALLAADLGALLRAGSDIRSALSVIASTTRAKAIQALVAALLREVSGGESLERALDRHLGPRFAFVSALVAAGEAAGDTAGGLERSAEILDSRMAIREQILSAISYPAFVFVTAVIAVMVILMFVIPTLAPLAEAPGADPSLAMRVLLGLSGFLNGNLLALGLAAGLLTAAAGAAWMSGLAAIVLDRLAMTGPARGTAEGLVYGGFAIALGGILAAGAPISEALRLSQRSLRSPTARRRLERLGHSVRQGEQLSVALGSVPGFPESIVRLARIGEETGAVGPMLLRAGRIEERTSLRRIEAAGRVLGPLLIVILGGLIGLLMAGLLSGVSGLGETALG